MSSDFNLCLISDISLIYSRSVAILAPSFTFIDLIDFGSSLAYACQASLPKVLYQKLLFLVLYLTSHLL